MTKSKSSTSSVAVPSFFFFKFLNDTSVAGYHLLLKYNDKD